MRKRERDIFSAVKANDFHVVQRLLAEGHDVNELSYDQMTPIFEVRSAAMVKLLVNSGADVHAKDDHKRSVLHWVTDGEAAKALIEAGAGVNYVNRSGGYSCFNSPLHNAMRSDETEVIKVLIEAGADVNARDNYGETPLFASRNVRAAQLLIEAGAVINAINHGGLTAIQSIREWRAELAEFVETRGSKGEQANLQTTIPAAQPEPVKRKAKAFI